MTTGRTNPMLNTKVPELVEWVVFLQPPKDLLFQRYLRRTPTRKMRKWPKTIPKEWSTRTKKICPLRQQSPSQRPKIRKVPLLHLLWILFLFWVFLQAIHWIPQHITVKPCYPHPLWSQRESNWAHDPSNHQVWWHHWFSLGICWFKKWL